MAEVFSQQEGQLGDVASWKVPAEVTLKELRAGLVRAGLDEGLASDMAPRNALRRALREMSKNRVIRKLKQDGEILSFQINQEKRENGHLEFPYEADVELNVTTGALGGTDGSIVTQARTLLDEHLEKRVTSDLTRLVQKVFDSRKAALIPIREQGGAYFVPDQHHDLIESCRVLLKAIGGNLRTFSVRLGSEDTAASVAESMTDYLLGLIGEFNKSCEEVTGDSQKRVSTKRFSEIGDMKSKLSCYRGLLRGFADQIETSINDAEKALIAKLAIKATPEEIHGPNGEQEEFHVNVQPHEFPFAEDSDETAEGSRV